MTPYIDFETGRHLKKEKVNEMINIMNEFQSLNRFKSIRTSRKDDMEMLCNILIYLRNFYELPYLKYPPGASQDS